MVNPIQSLSVQQAQTMMTAPSAAVEAYWNSIPKVDSIGNFIKAIGPMLSFLASKAAYSLGLSNTTYGIAVTKDQAPAAIRIQMEKVVAAASNEFLSLKRAANQGDVSLKTQGEKRALASFKAQVKILTEQAYNLARDAGKTDGDSVHSIGQALSNMFRFRANASANMDPDFTDAIAKHYILNSSLKAANLDFAERPMSKASFNAYLASFKMAFANVFSPNAVTVKFLKTLVPKLPEMIAFRDLHVGEFGEAIIVARTAVATAPFERTIAESIARVTALRGTNGFNGLIHQARLAYLQALQVSILTSDAATKEISATSGLTAEQISIVGSYDNDLAFAGDPERGQFSNAQEILEHLARATGQYSSHIEDDVQALMTQKKAAAVQAATARNDAFKRFVDLLAEYPKHGGATFNSVDFREVDGVRTYNVSDDSIIAKEQARIAAARSVVRAEAAATADFWNNLIPRIEAVRAEMANLKQVVSSTATELELVTKLGQGL